MEEIIEEEHIILYEYCGKIVKHGRYTDEEKNKYWFVININTNEQYYIMDCGKEKIVKIDEESINKIVGIKNCWYISYHGYVLAKIDDEKFYMHAYLMNHYGHGLAQGALSVDHINRDKLDNRLSNLRITTQSIQNSNRPYKKQENSKYNTNRPEGMEDIILPRHVEYMNGFRDTKNKTGFREFFILSHSKCPKYGKKNCVVSSKSINMSAIDKYNFIIDKMKELEIDIQYG